jgi:lipopolysaccharide transport system ATP-binding protein
MSSDSAAERGSLFVDGLRKTYRVPAEGHLTYRSLREDVVRMIRRPRRSSLQEFVALDGVSFSAEAGDRVGVIGRNGSGKSTLLKVLARITSPDAGRAEIVGRVGSLLEVGTGFHPELSGRDNIFLSGAILGLRRREIANRLDEIVDFAGVHRFIDAPVKRYSSGMYLRLAFAVASSLEPDILLVDEVLAVGDADFQNKCLGRMSELATQNRTVLFVSHSMSSVLRLCNRAVLLDRGRVVASGHPADVVRAYLGGDRAPGSREWGVDPRFSVAQLREVAVMSKGAVTDVVDIDEQIDIRVRYEHRSTEYGVRPSVGIALSNAEGVVLFSTHDFNDVRWRQQTRKPGPVESVLHIPANFLAQGTMTVLVGLYTQNPDIALHVEPDAVGFTVQDRTTGLGARGEYAGDWPGVVRPKLEWTITTAEAE